MRPSLTVTELKQKQERLSQMSESESSYSDTDSMPGGEHIMRLFNPITGEELDPDSALYQVLCRFLYNDNNHPGSSNQEDLHQGQHPLVKDYEGLLQATFLRICAKDNTELHCRIPNTRGRRMTH